MVETLLLRCWSSSSPLGAESRLLGLGASAKIPVTASLLGLEDLKQFARTALGESVCYNKVL